MNIIDVTKKNHGRFIIAVALILCVVASTVIGCVVKDNNNIVKKSVYTVESGITSIDSRIFGSVDTDVITDLIISKDVELIDFEYLNTFPLLQKITVDAENKHYASKDNYIVSKDGSVLYLYGTNTFDSEIFTFANEVCDLSQRVSGMTVIFGDAIMYINYTHDVKFDPYSCYLERLEAYGQILTYRSAFGGGRAPSIYAVQDYILLTDYGRMTGNTYIISEQGIWEYHTDENALTTAENYNEPIYTFSIDKNGICLFTCQPRKYLFTASAGDILTYSVGRDEVYSVEGSVTVTNGKPVISVVSSVKTLSDRYTEEQLLTELEFTNSSNELFDEPTYASLDELFNENASRFERFEIADVVRGWAIRDFTPFVSVNINSKNLHYISGIAEYDYGWYILSLDEPECYYFSMYDDNEESYHKNDSLSFPYFNEEHITQAFGEDKAFRLFWNGAILEVEYYIVNGTRYFDICSVEYGGSRLDLSSHPISNLRYSVRGYETEQGFVFSSDEDISKTWIFANEGIIEVATDNIGDTSIPGWYNLPVYQFYKRGDGLLCYTRRSYKALKSQDIVSQLQYIVAEDEIGMEEGFATVQNGELLFHPERTYTIPELYDLEKLFSDWLEYASSLSDEELESYGIFSKVKSLEELLQYNAAHYERAK